MCEKKISSCFITVFNLSTARSMGTWTVQIWSHSLYNPLSIKIAQQIKNTFDSCQKRCSGYRKKKKAIFLSSGRFWETGQEKFAYFPVDPSILWIDDWDQMPLNANRHHIFLTHTELFHGQENFVQDYHVKGVYLYLFCFYFICINFIYFFAFAFKKNVWHFLK